MKNAVKHVVSVSGGKDSTALLILAKIERGLDVTAVFADTGHEHDETYRYIEYLDKTIGPITVVRASFEREIERKRKTVAEKWRADGVPEERIALALDNLHPTGVPFLDLCIAKGRFPSTKARFCSQMLKHEPIREKIVEPMLADGYTVISWQGVRAEESRSRARLPIVDEPEDGLVVYRPLLYYTADEVFGLHRRHGVKWNPLYEQGMGRVGCMPCIHARKQEIAEIAKRWPEEIDRVAKWESKVSAASKRGISSFFAHDKTPGEHQGKAGIKMPGIREVARWAMTSRGGRQYVIHFDDDDLEVCSSIYGLCESAQ